MTLVPLAERAAAIAAIEQIVAHEPEADQILREAVVALYEHIPDVRSVAVAFVESGALAPGPIAGDPIASEPTVTVPVLYERRPVAELWIEGGGVARRRRSGHARAGLRALSPYCLVGWDTGGEAWEP